MSTTSLPTSPPMTSTMAPPIDEVTIASHLLGSLTVPRTELVDVPAGLYGFEGCHAFALVPAGRDGLWWLQSAERAELVFLLADPFVFFAGHVVDVPPAELAPLGATEDTPLMALVIVTLPARDGGAPTANLRAPVLLDPARRIARQVVLENERLSLTAALQL